MFLRLQAHPSEVQAGIGVFGVERNERLELAAGLGRIVLAERGHRKPEVRIGKGAVIRRARRDALAVSRTCVGVFAELEERLAAHHEERHVFRTLLKAGIDLFDGLLRVTPAKVRIRAYAVLGRRIDAGRRGYGEREDGHERT